MNSALDQDLQDFLKAISGETRQAILLVFLNRSRLTVNEISQLAKIGQSTASEHLAILKRAGIVTSVKEGKQVFYSPVKDEILSKIDSLKVFVNACC